jgi:hypothetical protein
MYVLPVPALRLFSAMGPPTSAILAETFIEHLEHKHTYPNLKTQEIIAYYRYADDILIIYDQNKHRTNT